MLRELLEDLDGYRRRQGEDVWWWGLEENGWFSVNSMYKKLEGMRFEEGSLTEMRVKVFTHIWKSSAPSKVVAEAGVCRVYICCCLRFSLGSVFCCEWF